MTFKNQKVKELNNNLIKYFQSSDKECGPKIFFEIAEKQYSDLIFTFHRVTEDLSFRNLIYFSLYTSLFLDFMFSVFNIKVSN